MAADETGLLLVGRSRPLAQVALIRAVIAVALALWVTLPPVPASASEAERIRSQLEELRADVRKAGAAYDKAYWRHADTQRHVDDTDRKIALTTKQLVAARGVLGQRIVSIYRLGGGVDYLSVLLGSATFDEMLTRLEFMRRVGEADADAVRRVAKLGATLRAERKALLEEQKERDAALGRLRKERNYLRDRLQRKQAEYERVLARVSPSVRAAVRSSAPRSGGRMAFPVAGVNYYSDTWGASRSGGRRRHQGTDIMAARGTPVVAVISGSVSASVSGLGGKSIWLHGDNGWTYFYAHLDSWAVRSGRVSRGQIIGYVGSTGNARGGAPHLHFEAHPGGGSAVNPYGYLRSSE